LFCVEHHLPEEHDCPGLKRGEWRVVELPNKYAIEYRIRRPEEVEVKPLRPLIRVHWFSPRETRDLLLAVVAVTLAYTSLSALLRPILFLTILLGVLLAFLVHELAHRYTAVNYGYQARFVASYQGLLLTAISALLPIKIIAPGYVAVYGGDRAKIGAIALAGPLSNIVMSIIGLILASLRILPLFTYLFAVINADFALFNLIPLGILDGYKIFNWNKIVWLTAFMAAIALWLNFRAIIFI